MNAQLARRLYNAVQYLRGEKVERELEKLKRSQFFPEDELLELQWAGFKDMVNYSYENVPYYRKTFDGLGLKPSDIKTRADLPKIPVLTRQVTISNSSELLSRTYTGRRFEYRSSGITGEPIVLKHSMDSMASLHAAKYRGHSWYGLDIGTKEGRIWGLPLDRKQRAYKRLQDVLMNRVRLSPFDLSGDNMKGFYNNCKRFGVKYIYGYSAAIYKFAQFLREEGLDGKRLDLNVIIFTAEVLYEFQRTLIKEVFGCPVMGEYGAAEVGIIAFECRRGRMHICAENVLVEFVRDGQPVHEGEPGEVIVTGLKDRSMPLIRYKLGDVATPSKGRCDCGVNLPLLEKVHGRSNDMAYSTDGVPLHSELFEYIDWALAEKGTPLKEFKVVQRSLKDFQVMILKYPDAPTTAAGFLKDVLLQHVGSDARINIEYVDEIPPEKSGKRRYFVSELDLDGDKELA